MKCITPKYYAFHSWCIPGHNETIVDSISFSDKPFRRITSITTTTSSWRLIWLKFNGGWSLDVSEGMRTHDSASMHGVGEGVERERRRGRVMCVWVVMCVWGGGKKACSANEKPSSDVGSTMRASRSLGVTWVFLESLLAYKPYMPVIL